MEAFVYCWTNETNGCKYVGYHKGRQDDGYVCSSKSERFWSDFNNVNMKWSRQIIAVGAASDCALLEETILRSIDLRLDEWYNAGVRGAIVHNEETKRKIGESMKGRNTGRIHTEEARRRMSASATGRAMSEESRKKMSVAKRGKPRSEETKRKIAEAMKRSHAKKRDLT